MFIYSSDRLIRQNEKRQELGTFRKLNKSIKIKHCRELETLFENHCRSPLYLQDFVHSMKTAKFLAIVNIIGREDHFVSKTDFQIGFGIKNSKSYDYIPYIKMSFEEPCKINTAYIDHAYLIFFTKHKLYEDSVKDIIHQFERFNKVRMFI